VAVDGPSALNLAEYRVDSVRYADRDSLVQEGAMTWKDKLEIGLKEDAPYRKDNLPEAEIRGPQVPTGPGRSAEVPLARPESSGVDSDADENAAIQEAGRTPAPSPEAE
jgi:hypothetical protein